MKLENIPFSTIDWEAITPTEHLGETGKALWRTFEMGNIRVRMVEYSANYKADHWCSRGHVLLVLQGELVTHLQDGRQVVLRAGMSYQLADNTQPHRSSTQTGVKLFIVD